VKCSECKNTEALILFSSIKCINKICNYFDKGWAEEVKDKKAKLLTSNSDTGAIYLGDEPYHLYRLIKFLF
jgi:hypothetical protein